ncbi:MAG: ComF family protein, partial [bacterium]
MRYQPPVDRLIATFKYHHKLAYGRTLAMLLADTLLDRDQPLPDVLIPVPMHATRLRDRGFNQASEIARQLSHLLGVPQKTGWLKRTRANPPQQGLNRAQRLKNLTGSFQFCGK